MSTITRLIGVYNADGGILGEVRYAVGKIRGQAHCGLCDITHRGVRVRTEWAEEVARLGVPFDLVHRNERSADVVVASAGREPCVLAEAGDGLHLVLGPAALERVDGDVAAFDEALRVAATAGGLTLTPL